MAHGAQDRDGQMVLDSRNKPSTVVTWSCLILSTLCFLGGLENVFSYRIMIMGWPDLLRDQATANALHDQGMVFLKSFGALGRISVALSRHEFLMKPKFHVPSQKNQIWASIKKTFGFMWSTIYRPCVVAKLRQLEFFMCCTSSGQIDPGWRCSRAVMVNPGSFGGGPRSENSKFLGPTLWSVSVCWSLLNNLCNLVPLCHGAWLPHRGSNPRSQHCFVDKDGMRWAKGIWPMV